MTITKHNNKIITDNRPTDYICQLAQDDQYTIKQALTDALIKCDLTITEFSEAFNNGMNGRICDLEDTIEIEYTK